MTIAGGKPERINQGRKSLFQFMVARLCGSYGGQNSVVIGGYLIIVASNPEEWEMKGPGVLRSLWFWLSPARPLWLHLQPAPLAPPPARPLWLRPASFTFLWSMFRSQLCSSTLPDPSHSTPWSFFHSFSFPFSLPLESKLQMKKILTQSKKKY